MKALLKYSKLAFRLTVVLFILLVPSLPFTAPTLEMKLLAIPFTAIIGAYIYIRLWR